MVVVTAVTMVVAVSSYSVDGTTSSPASESSGSAVEAPGADVTTVPVDEGAALEARMTVGDIGVAASAPSGVVDTSTTLTARPLDTSRSPNVGSLPVLVDQGVELEFQGDEQPSKGVELVLDMSKRPDYVDRISEWDRPIVISEADDPGRADLFAPEWDESAQTLTFTTYHFTPFWIGVLNVRTLADSTVTAVSELRSKSKTAPQPAPDCAPDPMIDGKQVSIEVAPLIDVAACVEARDGHAVVKLSSRSTQYFEVKSSAGGTYTPTGVPDVNAIVMQALPRSSQVLGLLTPGLSGELNLPDGVTDAKISVNVNPIYVQLATLGFAADVVVGGPLKGAGDVVEEMLELRDRLDCSLGLLGSVGATESGRLTSALVDCLVTLAQAGGKPFMRAFLSRVKSMYGLLRTGSGQLWANIAGIIGETNGANHVRVTITGQQPSQFSMQLKLTGLVRGSMALPSTFELDRYTRGRSVYSSWKLTSSPRSGCTARLVILGPQSADVSAKRCNGDTSMSVGMEVKTPGDYSYVFTLTGADGRVLGKETGTFTALPAPPR